MKLISSREAVTFLSKAAPRPWVYRVLHWMAFHEGLTIFARKGEIRPYMSVGSFTIGLEEQAGEFTGPKMDAAIREKFDPEFAEKLVGKETHDRVYDVSETWSEKDDPRALDIGFFLYASDIDWESGTLIADSLPGRGEMNYTFFPSDDVLLSEFEDADFDVELAGLSFEFSTIELLLPNFELRQSTGFAADKFERRRATGRPPKWDWEGAMAFVISLAQQPDGLPVGPGAQARIEELMANWFVDGTGDAPATSQIRQRASKIITSLERPKTTQTPG